MTSVAPERLLRLDVRCPECGAPPKLRITEGERDRAFRQPRALIRQTYECHIRSCNVRYPIRAAAFQDAS